MRIRERFSCALVHSVSAIHSLVDPDRLPDPDWLNTVGLWGPVRGKHFAMRGTQVGAGQILGTYERATVTQIRGTVRPGMRCYDVGASYGFYTLLLSDLVGSRGTVMAFEPDARDFSILAHNVEANHRKNVQLQALALGAAAGEVQFATFEYPGVSHIQRHDTPQDATIVSVECRTLDEVTGDASIDVLKIDVEGSELDVLKGAEKTLKRCHPTVIVECSEDSAPQVTALLSFLGYVPPTVLVRHYGLADLCFAAR